MGGGIKKAFSNPIRGLTAVSTFGTSELARRTPIGNAVFSAPERLANGLMGTKYGQEGVSDMAAVVPGGQSNPDLLAQTGGAPVLAQIALGVNAKDALAGYLGVNPSDWDNYVAGLSPKDASALIATQKQLETIQSNTNLRNQAVQKVIDDFPNITRQIAQDRAAAGGEFDSVTQGYMEQALKGTAAKLAAGGNISSGAANEAFAKTGANLGLQKLDYMGQREAASTQQNMAGFGARLAEVNALRDFQNTMLQGKASEGFSAAQANLGRIQQSGMANAEFMNQRSLMDQQNKQATQNALFGALGSLGGAWLGGSMISKQLAAGSLAHTSASQAPDAAGTSYSSTPWLKARY